MSKPYSEMEWRSHDGLRLYARIYDRPNGGAGTAGAAESAAAAGGVVGAPTVLCLHGLTRNSRDFEDLAPHLQTRYRVIVPDLRGRGLSARDPNLQNYQPAIYVQDVLALLGAAGATRVAVIGTSLGGMLAMMLGFGHPARIAGIVLNDIGPEIDPLGLERIKRYAGRLPTPRSWSEAAAQAQSVFGEAWPGLSPDRWAVLARRGYRENATGLVEVDADPGIGEALRAAPAAAPDPWPLWRALRNVPTLAIRGAHSDILSAAVFARMQRENPGVRQLEVANRGHVPLLDEPECVAAVDAFLSAIL